MRLTLALSLSTIWSNMRSSTAPNIDILRSPHLGQSQDCISSEKQINRTEVSAKGRFRKSDIELQWSSVLKPNPDDNRSYVT